MNKFKNGIGIRLLRYVFGCYLVVTILVTAIQLYSEYTNVRNDIFDQISNLEKSFKESFMNSIWVYDIEQLEITLFGVTKIDIISGVKIVNERNEELSSVGSTFSKTSQMISTKTLEHPRVKEIVLIQQGETQTQTLFEYSFALEYQEEEGGKVNQIGNGYFYTDVNTVLDRVWYSFILIVINSVIKTAALWFFFLYFINRFIAKPLNALTNAASALNPDKIETLNNSTSLDRVFKSKYKDELYQLAASFDHMRKAILNKMGIIETQKADLEEKVLARTQSLVIANQELQHLALHDSLTSLPNRTFFQNQLDQYIKNARENATHFIVVSIDLTEFKYINDNYGHQIGDFVLIEVAKRLSNTLGKTDSIARIGGDEFYALLPLDSLSTDEELTVRRYITALAKPIVSDDLNVPSIDISVNVGAAIYPIHGKDATLQIKNADTAMYHAKSLGADYALYSDEESARLKRKSQLSQDFKVAIENHQLFLVYQPILDIKRDKIRKIEALVRWQHPTLGLISPDEFIPICERSGKIHELTLWVFYEASKQCKLFCEFDSNLTVSINLSGRVFSEPELPSILGDICKKSNISPSSINIEVTESTTMEKPEQAISMLNQLTDKGFSISIDDFGTGYSSFSYLILLPVNELKIDKSFLLNMGKKSDKVIKAMIELAHSLNLKVVGEGVETLTLLNLLDKMGCDYAQGYYIAKPLTVHQMHNFLDTYSNGVIEQIKNTESEA
jgi:diguanylate cyclase (GGDEF)-like protein